MVQVESDSKTHRTPKHFMRNARRRLSVFAQAFGVRARPRVAFAVGAASFRGDAGSGTNAPPGGMPNPRYSVRRAFRQSAEIDPKTFAGQRQDLN